MTIQSKATEYRLKAAQQFRAARTTLNVMEQTAHTTQALGYKSLAAAEEWLAGTPQRSASPGWACVVWREQGIVSTGRRSGRDANRCDDLFAPPSRQHDACGWRGSSES